MNSSLLLGDEAIAQAALDAGISGVYAYPGTPSTEITEYIQASLSANERGVHSHWSTNEKTAMEAALGMAFAGKRALVCMKHVGVNVAADAFMNAAVTGVVGGLVLVAADDPSMHSSQNEQDSRFYGQFALIPILEPSSQQEAYDMVFDAFDLSETMGTPVMLRITTRLAHSRAGVARRTARGKTPCVFRTTRTSLCCCLPMPVNSTTPCWPNKQRFRRHQTLPPETGSHPEQIVAKVFWLPALPIIT